MHWSWRVGVWAIINIYAACTMATTTERISHMNFNIQFVSLSKFWLIFFRFVSAVAGWLLSPRQVGHAGKLAKCLAQNYSEGTSLAMAVAQSRGDAKQISRFNILEGARLKNEWCINLDFSHFLAWVVSDGSHRVPVHHAPSADVAAAAKARKLAPLGVT